MDRVAFYACLYKDKDFETSIKSQYRACHLKLEEHDYEVAGYYSDQRSIGDPNRRNGLLKLLRDAQAGKIDYVLTSDNERLALNHDNLVAIAHHFKLADVEIYSCIGNGLSLSQHLDAEIEAAEEEAMYRMAMEWERRMDAEMALDPSEYLPDSTQQSAFEQAAAGEQAQLTPPMTSVPPQHQAPQQDLSL